MTRRRLKKLGIDDIVSVWSKYIYSSILIRSKYPNKTANHKIENLKVISRDDRKVGRKLSSCHCKKNRNFKSTTIVLCQTDYIQLVYSFGRVQEFFCRIFCVHRKFFKKRNFCTQGKLYLFFVQLSSVKKMQSKINMYQL